MRRKDLAVPVGRCAAAARRQGAAPGVRWWCLRGVAAGLAGALGAQLVSRFDLFVAETELRRLLESADLVITAESALDSSTALGKIAGEVARRAKRHGTPVIALCGTIGPDAATAYASGLDALTGIATGPAELDDMIRRAPELIADATERALQMLLVGRSFPAACARKERLRSGR